MPQTAANRAVGPNGQQEGGHVCGICMKSFDRRDLRDRHKRRCQQSSQRPRVCKQKSCASCARSKLKCTLDQPSCERCLDRDVPCEYPAQRLNSIASTTSSVSSNHSSIAAGNNEFNNLMTPISPRSSEDLNIPRYNNGFDLDWTNDFSSSAGSSVGSADMWDQSDFNAHMDFPDFPMNDTFDSRIDWNNYSMQGGPPLEMFNTDPVIHGSGHPSIFQNNSMGVTMDRSVSNQSIAPETRIPMPARSITTDCASIGSMDMSNQPTPAANPDQMFPQHRPSMSSRTSSSVNSDTFSLNSNGGVLTENSLAQWSVAPSRQISKDSRRPSISPLQNQGSQRMNSTSLASAIHSPISEPVATATTPRLLTHSVPADESLISIVREYPKALLDRNAPPPFVHPLFYPAEGIHEFLAVALCCVTAHATAVVQGSSFIDNMMNHQRDTLINSLASRVSSQVDAIAALHAMCIYSILGLLSPNACQNTNQIKTAELHHVYLLKMTRLICQQHLDAETCTGTGATTWQSWVMAETLRRTIFMVNNINTLAYRSRSLDPYYYEPLNDNLVMHLALPSSEAMWKATSEQEWEAARAVAANSEPVMTVPQLADKLNSAGPAGLTTYNELQEFTQLTMACIIPSTS